MQSCGQTSAGIPGPTTEDAQGWTEDDLENLAPGEENDGAPPTADDVGHNDEEPEETSPQGSLNYSLGYTKKIHVTFRGGPPKQPGKELYSRYLRSICTEAAP
jgi:hypothetical protein